MPTMPSLGPQPKNRSALTFVLVVALVAGAAAGIGWWFGNRAAGSQEPLAQGDTPKAADAGVAEAPPPTPPTPPSPEEKRAQVGLKLLSIRVDGPLEKSIVAAVGRDVGEPLTQVVTRTLVWWLKVPADLRKGDALEALYEERKNEEPLVVAVRFSSGKLEKTFRAYRFKPEGSQFARYYQADGTELEERMEDAPLDDYEQVTSLLRDGRNHRGVDFKAPVGTPVKATFNGTVSRKNWNFRGNGNCLEILETGGQGRTAMFLHLSEVSKSLQPGQKVAKGEVVAHSGNTGRSFAPHLHYQLMLGERVIDPFTSHKIYRRSLDGAAKPALEAEEKRLDTLLSAAPPEPGAGASAAAAAP